MNLKAVGGLAWASAGTGAILVLAGLIPLGAESSNIGYWVTSIGFDRLGPLIPATADIWAAAAGLAAIAIATLLILTSTRIARGPHIKREAGSRRSGIEKKLIDAEWVLTYDPEHNLTKEISFNPDGTIGKGRNQNEHTWSIEGKYLDIFRESGLLQNRFGFHESGERLNFVREPRAMGTKGQRIRRTR